MAIDIPKIVDIARDIADEQKNETLEKSGEISKLSKDALNLLDTTIAGDLPAETANEWLVSFKPSAENLSDEQKNIELESHVRTEFLAWIGLEKKAEIAEIKQLGIEAEKREEEPKEETRKEIKEEGELEQAPEETVTQETSEKDPNAKIREEKLTMVYRELTKEFFDHLDLAHDDYQPMLLGDKIIYAFQHQEKYALILANFEEKMRNRGEEVFAEHPTLDGTESLVSADKWYQQEAEKLMDLANQKRKSVQKIRDLEMTERIVTKHQSAALAFVKRDTETLNRIIESDEELQKDLKSYAEEREKMEKVIEKVDQVLEGARMQRAAEQLGDSTDMKVLRQKAIESKGKLVFDEVSDRGVFLEYHGEDGTSRFKVDHAEGENLKFVIDHHGAYDFSMSKPDIFPASTFESHLVYANQDPTKMMEKDTLALQVHQILSSPKYYERLMRNESLKNQITRVFSNPENCSQVKSILSEFYANGSEISWTEAFHELMDPYVSSLDEGGGSVA